MKFAKKLEAAILAAVTAAAAMSGCTQLEEKTEKDTLAVTFGDENIMLDYIMYQMRGAQYSYENLFSSWYGTTDFWNQEYSSGVTIEEYVISTVMTGIRQTKVLCDYAEKNGISLTEEQKEKTEEAVKTSWENMEEAYKTVVGVTEEMLDKIYTENALANVVYLSLVSDVDTTTDPMDFVFKDITYVRLTPSDLEEETEAQTAEETVSAEETSAPASEAESESAGETAAAESTAAETTAAETTAAETETEAVTEEATTVEATLSAEEILQNEKMEAAASDIAARIEKGESAEDLAAEYKEDTSYFSTVQSTSTIGADSTYVYAEAAYALEEGQTSIYHDESTGNIYVLYCTEDYDEEAAQDAIDSEIENRKADLFAERYETIQAESPKFTIVEDVIAAINFKTALYVPETEEETSAGSAEEVSSEAETAAQGSEEAETETKTEAETEAGTSTSAAAETTEEETTAAK